MISEPIASEMRGDEGKDKKEEKEEKEEDMDVEETIAQLKKEVKEEDALREKAKRHAYKYKEIYGKIFYTDIP